MATEQWYCPSSHKYVNMFTFHDHLSSCGHSGPPLFQWIHELARKPQQDVEMCLLNDDHGSCFFYFMQHLSVFYHVIVKFGCSCNISVKVGCATCQPEDHHVISSWWTPQKKVSNVPFVFPARSNSVLRAGTELHILVRWQQREASLPLTFRLMWHLSKPG